MQTTTTIDRLIEIVAALRTPETGCSWDLQQTHKSLAPYALDEAYEVVDAIDRGDLADLRDELGDLLLQVVLHARLAEETGAFTFADVVEAVSTKIMRRHPHVFDRVPGGLPPSGESPHGAAATGPDAPTLTDGLIAAMAVGADGAPVMTNKVWETIKAEERKAKGVKGLLADVAPALPGLTRAVKLQRKASTVGFDWSDARLVLAKIREETDELERELDGPSPSAIAEELGDLIFAVANLARHVDADPEAAVRGANAKFERRFAHIEARLAARGLAPEDATLAEMEALWQEAKAVGL